MIIRISAKVAKKIKATRIAVVEQSENVFADWSTHVFQLGRTQYLLVVNTATLYSIVIPGKGITSNTALEQAISIHLEEHLSYHGLIDVWQKRIKPETKNIIYAKALNRSITGCITDLIFRIKEYTKRGGELSETVEQNNHIPYKHNDFETPSELFRL